VNAPQAGRQTVARAVTWWALALLAVPAIGATTAVGPWAGGPLTSLVGFLLATAAVMVTALWTLRDDS
jgi:hypothetical protein